MNYEKMEIEVSFIANDDVITTSSTYEYDDPNRTPGNNETGEIMGPDVLS